MSGSIYDDDDLLGDPTTIEEIVEGEIEDGNASESNSVAGEDTADGEENAVPQLETEPQGVAVEPKQKRIIRNPQPKLNPERLKGPRGIAALEETFKDFEFHGKGYEKTDLNLMMKRLEHWAHRLFPKFTFDDCLQKIEVLGRKKEIATYMKRVRMGLDSFDVPIVQNEEINTAEVDEEPIDAFDALISQQLSEINHTQSVKLPSSPMESVPIVPSQNPPMILTEEQKERIRRNRLLAEQKQLERLKATQAQNLEKNEQNFIEANESPDRIILSDIQTDSSVDKNLVAESASVNTFHSNVEIEEPHHEAESYSQKHTVKVNSDLNEYFDTVSNSINDCG